MLTRSPKAGAAHRGQSALAGLAALLAFSTILLVSWTFVVPIFETPDEGSHWGFARYLHDHRKLPFYDNRVVEGNQPPTYYLLIAPFASDGAVPKRQLNDGPAGMMPCYPRVFNACATDFARFWPLRGARLLTALISVLSVLFVYLAGVEATGSVYAGILAGCLLIGLPEFAFRGGSISNDALVATTSALATYWIIRLLRRGFSVKSGIIASLCVALAFLSKISAIILVPVLAGALLSFPGNLRTRMKHLSVMLAAAVAVAPWLIRNQILYGELLASKAMLTAVPGLIDQKPLSSPWFIQVFPSAMGMSLVGAFGALADVYLAAPVVKAFGYLILVALAGLLLALWRRSIDWKIAVVLFALPVLAIASAVQLNMTLSQPQGRYLFAGLPALAVLTALGLRGLPGWNRVLHYVTIALLAAVSIYALLGVELPSFWQHPNVASDMYVSFSPATPAGPLAPTGSFGQTFVAHGSNLSSVEVEVATYSRTIHSGLVNLHLRDNPASPRDIAHVSIPANQIQDNTFLSLKFPPIPDSKGRSFYFFLDAQGLPPETPITVWLSNSDVYANGQFYLNGAATPRDMLFGARDTGGPAACGDCQQ